MYVTTVDTAASTSDMNNIAFRLCAMGYQSIHVTSQRTGNNETKAYPTIRICLLITLTGDCLSRNAQTSYAKCPLWVINPNRKREERKDRLHQNYLKRKASGAQKRYEDKIKAAKKAEMDEKKNAIRAEDIARGVFIPVSNLPKREPQKGAITA